MEWKLRPFSAGTLAVAVALGTALAPVAAEANSRPVAGNRSVWDTACQKSPRCMPAGDLGNGINGYIVTNPDGTGTIVYCNDTRCAGQDTPAPPPERKVPTPPKAIVDALAGQSQLGAASAQKNQPAAGVDPLHVIQMK